MNSVFSKHDLSLHTEKAAFKLVHGLTFKKIFMKIRQNQRVGGKALSENDRGYSKRHAKTTHVHERSIHCLFGPSLSPI